MSTAFFPDGKAGCISRFAFMRAPRRDELSQAHDMVSRERAVSLRCEYLLLGRSSLHRFGRRHLLNRVLGGLRHRMIGALPYQRCGETKLLDSSQA